MMAIFDPKDPKSMKHLRGLLHPHQVDQSIRQAIQFCWMALPAKRQSVAEVEKQIRRVVDRALRDLREDSKEFGLGS